MSAHTWGEGFVSIVLYVQPQRANQQGSLAYDLIGSSHHFKTTVVSSVSSHGSYFPAEMWTISERARPMHATCHL
eukprot:4940260-Amphidinium_carterae.1